MMILKKLHSVLSAHAVEMIRAHAPAWKINLLAKCCRMLWKVVCA